MLLAPSQESLVGAVLDNRYELREVLGEGGMGVVYLAHQPTMERDVAVKVLHPYHSRDKEALQRFLREARSASKLRHPNTIRVFDFGQTSDGLLYMVLEILHGRSLADIIDYDGRLHYLEAIDIGVQICDALSEAHELGIIHRDLKPDNIHIEQAHGRPNHVKLLDFGIARMESDVRTTQTGAIVGTPTYMSPEQATGKSGIDGRSDIYAMGCIMYEMITGEMAFQGSTPLEVLVKHLNEDPPLIVDDILAEIPGALVDIIHRALAKDPNARFATSRELRDALIEVSYEPVAGSPFHEGVAGVEVDLDSAQAFEEPRAPRNDMARISDVGLRPPVDPAKNNQRPEGYRSPTPDRGLPGGLTPIPGIEAQPRAAAATTHEASTPPPELDATRRDRPSSPRFRPANIPLERASNGDRYELLMSSADRGVLQCIDCDPPQIGARIELIGNDVVMRNIQLTVEVISTDYASGKPWFNVAWLQFAASDPKQMRAAFHKLLHEAVAIPADYDHLTEELWLAFDLASERFSAIPTPMMSSRRRRHSSKRLRAAKPRRILDVSSKKGRKS